MLESTTERLERINNLTIHRDFRKHSFRAVEEADLMWLIKQAERVLELEGIITERYRGYVSLLDENEQLSETLQHIAEHFFLGEGHEGADQVANSLISKAREGLGKGWWLND